MFYKLYSENPEDNSNDWYKSLEQKLTNGVQSVCYQKSLQGHVLNIVRQDALLKNVDFNQMNEVGKEIEKYWKYWDVHNAYKEWKLIETNMDADG